MLGIYFLLFMLSASQTPGMKMRQLMAVSREGVPLEPKTACMRGFGYFHLDCAIDAWVSSGLSSIRNISPGRTKFPAHI